MNLEVFSFRRIFIREVSFGKIDIREVHCFIKVSSRLVLEERRAPEKSALERSASKKLASERSVQDSMA